MCRAKAESIDRPDEGKYVLVDDAENARPGEMLEP
jgi:hypothetical protein